MEKIPCKACGTMILPATANKNAGLCMPCERGVTTKCSICGERAFKGLEDVGDVSLCEKCRIVEEKNRPAQIVNWEEVKEILFELCHKSVTSFAGRHKKETFYGFAIACNAEYGEVLLYLNTEKGLKKRAIEAIESDGQSVFPEFDKMMMEKYGVKHEKSYEGKSLEDVKEMLRWDIGGWEYNEINDNQDFLRNPWRKWEKYQEAISDLTLEDNHQVVIETFLNMACSVLIRMKKANTFKEMQISENFKTIVVDHDESVEEGIERLDKMRKKS